MADEQHEAILQDPSAHSVDDVLEALAVASDEELVQIKARENEGKARKTILDYVPPSAASAPGTFETDEKHSLEGWQERAGWFEFGGRAASPHAIAGALHDLPPGTLVTQGQVARRLEKFGKQEATA